MGRPARRTARHCDQVEQHGVKLLVVFRTVEEVTADGKVEPHERELLRDVLADCQGSYAPLPREASLIDNGLQLVGALVTTLEPTPWVERKAREWAEDEAALAAA